jgi:hypothetical protein
MEIWLELLTKTVILLDTVNMFDFGTCGVLEDLIFTKAVTKLIKPRVLFKLKLQASRIRFILYFLGHQKQSILKRTFYLLF